MKGGTSTDPKRTVLFKRVELHLERQSYQVILIPKCSSLYDQRKKIKLLSQHTKYTKYLILQRKWISNVIIFKNP